MRAIFLIWKNFVYIVKIPNNVPMTGPSGAYYYAREKLNVSEQDITVWGQVIFNERGIAKFHYKFYE